VRRQSAPPLATHTRPHSPPPRSALTSLLSGGECVEFTVQEAADERSSAKAVGVRVLPAGSVSLPRARPARARAPEPPQLGAAVMPAVVVRELRGGQRGRAEAYGGRLELASGEQLDFTGADLLENAPARLPLGAHVTLRVATEPGTGARRAACVGPPEPLLAAAALGAAPAAEAGAAAAAPPTPPPAGDARQFGRVTTLKESFGFIRVHNSSARLFFHFSQVEGGVEAAPGRPALAEGVEASFLVGPDRRTGKTTAQALRLLPPGSLAAPEAPAAAPRRSDASSWARGGEAPPQAAAAAAADDPAAPPSEGDGPPGQALRGAPPPRPPFPGAARELGCVAVLREKYGFIKCVARPGDLFFHVTELRGAPGWQPAAGEDVEFWAQQDARSAKLVATDVRPAPKGAAVFDRIDPGRLRGVCIERLPAKGGSRGEDGQLQPPTGLIELLPTAAEAAAEAAAPPAEAAAGEGLAGEAPPERVRLPFTRSDLSAGTQPRPGDVLELSLLTELRSGARRATAISIPLQQGVVVATKPAFGFLEPAGDALGSARIFYHNSEVEGGVALAPRDTVDFILCTNGKTGERNARRVRLLSSGAALREAEEAAEAARLQALRERHAASGGGGGALAARTPVRIVEGPPDAQAKGFGLGRGAAKMAYGCQGGLRPSAAPFEPVVAAAAGPRLAAAEAAGAFAEA